MTRREKRAMEDRLRLALEFYEAGIQMKRLRIQEQAPGLSRAEVERRLRAWIEDRPPDAPGRVVAWPRRSS